MGYEIGRVFSDAIFNSIERARDRAAANPGMIRRERRPRDTSLEEAMLRAQAADKDRALRRELGVAELGLSRDRTGLEHDRGLADLGRRTQADLLDYDAKMGSLASQDDYRRGSLDIRQQEADNRLGRYEARGAYEDKVAEIRGREAAADESRARTAAETAALRQEAESVKSVQQAQALLLRAKSLAMRPNPDGEIDEERLRAFLPTIREIEVFLRRGKGMPEDVSTAARKVRAAIAAGSGLAGIDDGTDPMLDMALDDDEDDDSPARFGQR